MERELSFRSSPIMFSMALTLTTCRMIAIAVIALSVGHPMFYFAPMMRQPKARGDENMEELPSSEDEVDAKDEMEATPR